MTPLDKNEPPYKILAIEQPYYENKKIVRCALRYVETGQVNSSFKWAKWLGEESWNSSKNLEHIRNVSIEGKEEFDPKWISLMKEMGLNVIESLNVGRMEIDMYQLYCSVMKRGGMHYVTKQQLWGEIYEDLSSSTFSTNYPSFLKKYYKK